ncbi:exopolysaccharide synthesis protein [Martelella endophytica]|uniref:Exopolysaccharide synthesis protein n=1 Tax=Martelella endophytica TaxID=1486262 RepID=A0A0D5LVM0_MAREN|nr:exopolysaccharide biosynthesis protein [Martelella endophytica]AJY47822.1 exopolysaccharide synthesis protein [Martelella endophytica]
MAQGDKNDEHSLTGITREALKSADGQEVSVNDMMKTFGATSFVPLLILPALLVVSPLGGVPGLSSLFGIMIVLIAAQRVLGRDNIWLPGFIRNRSIGSDKAESAMKKILPVTRFVDRYSRQRLTFLFRPPLVRLLPLACVLAGAGMPLFEIVPFASAFLGAAVVLMAYSMLTRDGIFALLALFPIAGGLWFGQTVLF